MNKRFNIWMITKWYPNREDPQFGVFIQKHAQAISKFNDISVLFVHSVIGQKNKFEFEEKNRSGVNEIIVYYRKDESSFKKIINFFRYLSASKKGIEILEKKYSNPEVIHAYILTRPAVLAWILSLRKKIPFIISEQWSGFVTGKFSKSSSIKKIITKFIVRRASAVTSVSEFLLNGMKECGLSNSKYKVISNIVEPVYNLTNTNHNDYVSVLMVADLVDEIKNISAVIKMISRLPGEINFRLKIIGRGADGDKLKELASGLGLLDSKIFFEGLKSNEEVYEYLHQCDFLVMNSRFETFSLICAEAMSCGKPVLATRCGGPNEFVNDETGILITPGDDAELENKFLFMLKHFHDYNAEKISKYTQSMFSAEKAGIAFRDLYTSII